MQAEEKIEVLGAYFKDTEGNNLECVPDDKADEIIEYENQV